MEHPQKMMNMNLYGEEENEIEAYMNKIHKTKLSKEAKEKALSEVKKLKSMSAMSSEATVIRNYLDWLLDIPWYIVTEDRLDAAEAQKLHGKALFAFWEYEFFRYSECVVAGYADDCHTALAMGRGDSGYCVGKHCVHNLLRNK